MREVLFTVGLILATAGFIALIRFVTRGMIGSCSRPSAELRIVFDEHCECLEYTLGRICKCPALSGVDLKVIVVDTVNTEASAEWLSELRKKLKMEFEIESG